MAAEHRRRGHAHALRAGVSIPTFPRPTAAATSTSALFGIYRWGWFGGLDQITSSAPAEKGSGDIDKP